MSKINMKQLLRNYLFLLKQKANSIPKENLGDIEFIEDEIKRVDQALAQGG